MFSKRKVSMDKGRLKLSEEKVTNLIDGMLKNNVPIRFSPKSDEYFLIDEIKQVTLCLEQSKIRVANHNYIYYVPLKLSFVEAMKSKVQNEMESRTQALKKNLFKNEMELLDKITKNYE